RPARDRMVARAERTTSVTVGVMTDSFVPHVHEALRTYLQGLLGRSIGTTEPMSRSLAVLLSAPGLALSDGFHSVLPIGVVGAYSMFAPNDWPRVIPAAAAIELSHLAVEVYDKFLDDEALGDIAEHPGVSLINDGSCLQALAHLAIDDLHERGFSLERVA